MKPTALLLIPLSAPALGALSAAFDVIDSPKSGGQPVLDDRQRASIAAVVTNGSTGCSGALMAQLPALRVVAAFGAGYENIDVAAATARGVQVVNSPGANAATVADHALGLALAVARDTCARNAAVHGGGWDDVRAARPTLNGSTVGIIGMGQIGRLVARRAAAFDASIAYYDRQPRADVEGRFCDSVEELAGQSDFLIATCPGGPSTHHLVNASVLRALGPGGFVVNVSRGTVVDTGALVQALREGTIAGAALDVVEEEPHLPLALRQQDNVVLTPHMAGRSPAAIRLQTGMMLTNLAAALRGEVCPNRV